MTKYIVLKMKVTGTHLSSLPNCLLHLTICSAVEVNVSIVSVWWRHW